jgi:hypothetical protein
MRPVPFHVPSSQEVLHVFTLHLTSFEPIASGLRHIEQTNP